MGRIVYVRALPSHSPFSVNEPIVIMFSVAVESDNPMRYDVVVLRIAVAGRELRDSVVLPPATANPKAVDARVVLPTPRQLGLEAGSYTVTIYAVYGGDTRKVDVVIRVVSSYRWPLVAYASVEPSKIAVGYGEEATLRVTVRFDAEIPPPMVGEPVYVKVGPWQAVYRVQRGDVWRMTLVITVKIKPTSSGRYTAYVGVRSPYEGWRVVWRRDGVVEVQVRGAPAPQPPTPPPPRITPPTPPVPQPPTTQTGSMEAVEGKPSILRYILAVVPFLLIPVAVRRRA